MWINYWNEAWPIDEFGRVLKSLTPLILFLTWESTKVLIIASSLNVQLTNIQHIFYASDLILTFDSNQKKKKREKKSNLLALQHIWIPWYVWDLEYNDTVNFLFSRAKFSTNSTNLTN